jgi:hypothetical protein
LVGTTSDTTVTTVAGTETVWEDTTTTLGAAEEREDGRLVGVTGILTGVFGIGSSTTTVPVWPSEVGVAAVVRTAVVIPTV